MVSKNVYVRKGSSLFMRQPMSVYMNSVILTSPAKAPSAGHYVKKRPNQLVRNNPVATMSISNGGEVRRGAEAMAPVPVGAHLEGVASRPKLQQRPSWRSSIHSYSLKRAAQMKPWTPPWKRLPCPAIYRPQAVKRKPWSPNPAPFSKVENLYTSLKGGFSLKRSAVRSTVGSNLTWRKSEKGKDPPVSPSAIRRKYGKALKPSQQPILKKPSCQVSSNSAGKVITVGQSRYSINRRGKTIRRLPDTPKSRAAAPEGAAHPAAMPSSEGATSCSYVWAGNYGTKLVRDGRATAKILARERVRYSLHNARLRKSKSNSLCQFYSRFGTCKKKETGSCPYVHDPLKVAICTKFLQGKCTNENCPLTHKVISDRMPDCSHFLEGFCGNEDCQYRHLHVHSQAPVCEGFLKGFCEAQGKCGKKHTYVCQSFASTGTCALGGSCKMYHPKAKSSEGGPRKKGRERRQEQPKRSQRYFGGSCTPADDTYTDVGYGSELDMEPNFPEPLDDGGSDDISDVEFIPLDSDQE